MNLGVARLLEQGTHDVGSLDDVAPAPDLENVDHVAKVVESLEPDLGVAGAELSERVSRFSGVAGEAPLLSELAENIGIVCHESQ